MADEINNLPDDQNQNQNPPEDDNDNGNGNSSGITTLEDALAELKRVRQEAASRRIANKELEEKAKRWEEYEESQKTELQKLQEQLAERDKKLTSYELKEMKLGLIEEFGLEKDDLDLLTGSDEASNRKIAEKLKAKNEKIKESATTSRPADLLAGNRGTPIGHDKTGSNPEASFDSFIRKLAGRG